MNAIESYNNKEGYYPINVLGREVRCSSRLLKNSITWLESCCVSLTFTCVISKLPPLHHQYPLTLGIAIIANICFTYCLSKSNNAFFTNKHFLNVGIATNAVLLITDIFKGSIPVLIKPENHLIRGSFIVLKNISATIFSMNFTNGSIKILKYFNPQISLENIDSYVFALLFIFLTSTDLLYLNSILIDTVPFSVITCFSVIYAINKLIIKTLPYKTLQEQN